MKLSVKLDNGYLPDKYSKYADFQVNGSAVTSFPFVVSQIPEGTKYLAWSFLDYDSTPVCGFTWIHWLTADVEVNGDTVEIPENFAKMNTATQGYNSKTSKFLQAPDEVKTGYVGPCPPDKDHTYTLHVYALDEHINLDKPFYYNELLKAVHGHIISEVKLDIVARV